MANLRAAAFFVLVAVIAGSIPVHAATSEHTTACSSRFIHVPPTPPQWFILGCADGSVEDEPVSPGGSWNWNAVLLVTPGSCGSYRVSDGPDLVNLVACCPDNETDPQPCGRIASFTLPLPIDSEIFAAETCSWLIASGSHLPPPFGALTSEILGEANLETCSSELIEATPDSI